MGCGYFMAVGQVTIFFGAGGQIPDWQGEKSAETIKVHLQYAAKPDPELVAFSIKNPGQKPGQTKTERLPLEWLRDVISPRKPSR
jgi:hypothetical protein